MRYTPTVADKLRRYGIRKDPLAPESITVGKAQDAWKSWDLKQRRVALSKWCLLSTAQIRMFQKEDWFRLSRHIRRSLKRHVKGGTSGGQGVVLSQSGSPS